MDAFGTVAHFAAQGGEFGGQFLGAEAFVLFDAAVAVGLVDLAEGGVGGGGGRGGGPRPGARVTCWPPSTTPGCWSIP
ncbi:hypothetical protein, partial [Nocardia cyriacigeorgica]|uniref:hypothetical protein n=1 Tax=Nocardia cyriacigeorgica TaxID=135487 RepID=UPI0024547676